MVNPTTLVLGEGWMKVNKETIQDIDFSSLQYVSDTAGSVEFGIL